MLHDLLSIRRLIVLLLLLFIASDSKAATIYLNLSTAGSNAPQISNLSISVTGTTTATCSWTTNITTTSNNCFYGTSPLPNSTSCTDSNTTSHTCNITGLTAGTHYYANVSSTANSLTTVSSDIQFTTNSASTVLISKYICDEGTGTTCADQTDTNTLNLTNIIWNATAGQTCNNTAIQNNGSSTTVATLTAASNINHLNQFSVCGVLYCTGYGTSERIYSKESSADFDDTYAVVGSSGSLLIQLYDSTGNAHPTYTGNNVVALNTRTPVCLTYDGTKAHIWANGTEQSYLQQPTIGAIRTTANNWKFLNNASGNNPASCTLDNIYIDNYAVNSTTVSTRANECSVPSAVNYYVSPSGNDTYSGTTTCISSCPTVGGVIQGAWKTFSHALTTTTTQPGIIINAMDGTWDEGSNCSTDCNGVCPSPCASGISAPIININCGASVCSGSGQNSNCGTSTKPITIQSVNDRKAFIKADNLNGGIQAQNCNYWNIGAINHGFRVDGWGDALGTNRGGAQLVEVDNASGNGTVKIIGNLISNVSRWQNVNPITIGGNPGNNTGVVIQNNEVYRFTRYGINVFRGNTNYLLQNYINSRNYGDFEVVAGTDTVLRCNDSWNTGDPARMTQNAGAAASTVNCGCGTGNACNPTSCPSPARAFKAGDNCSQVNGYIQGDEATGDNGESPYYATNTYMYNDISERSITGNGGPEFNKGDIQNNNQVNGIFAGNKVFTYSNELSLNTSTSGATGINFNTVAAGTSAVSNSTIFNTNGNGFQATPVSGTSPTLNLTNLLSFNNTGGKGISINSGFSGTLLNSNTAGNNSSDNVDGLTSTNVTHNTPTLMGTGTNQCIVYVPGGNDGKGNQNPQISGASSNMAAAGNGTVGGRANDIGADIVWQYDTTGALTTNKMWNQTTGAFAVCGATVNDSLLNTSDANGNTVDTEACGNVHKRLFPTGCPIP